MRLEKKTVAAIIAVMMVLQFCFPTAVVLAEELNGEVEPGMQAVVDVAPPEEEGIPIWGG